MSRYLTIAAACTVSLGLAAYATSGWFERASFHGESQGPAPAGGRSITAGSISFVVPAGWQHGPLKGSPEITIVRPAGVDDSAAWLVIPPGETLHSDVADWAADRWGALPFAKVGEQMQRGRTPSGGEWVMVGATLHRGIDGMKPVVFQAASEGRRVQPLFWHFRDEESLSRYGGALDQIAQSIRFLAPQDWPAPSAVPLAALVPPTCVGCIHTFTGAPPASPGYILGTWASGTIATHYSGSVPQYADGRVYTFRPDGTYALSGSMEAAGAGTVIVHEVGRYSVQESRITLQRERGEVNNNGQVSRSGPRTVTYEWRPALNLGTKQPMLVLRASQDEEWEGLFQR